MREQIEIDKTCVSEMTNEEYREELVKIFEGVESNRLLRYFYISSLEKIQQKKTVDYQVSNIDYGNLIIEMVEKIENKKLLIKIYDYINAWLN